MKKFLTAFCILALSSVMILPCAAVSEADVPRQNLFRFDDSYDDYRAFCDHFITETSEHPDALNHLNTFPALPESMLRLFDEYRNNSCALEEKEFGEILLKTEALKIAYDERMLGVKVSALFDENGEYVERNLDHDIRGMAGTASLMLPFEFCFEDMRGLRIFYYANAWPDDPDGFNSTGYYHSFEADYTVEDGRITLDYVRVSIEDGFIMIWSFGGNILDISFENQTTDALYYRKFDIRTGERYSEN